MIRQKVIYSLLSLATLITSCNDKPQKARIETETPVEVARPSYRRIQRLITTTSTAKANKEIEINSEVEGAYELQVNPRTGQYYKLGDLVQEGAPIIKIRNREYENNQQLESKKLQIEITLKEWEGQKSLYEKGGATQKDVNNALNQYINAKLNLENAEINLDKMSIKAPFTSTIVTLPHYTQGVDIANNTPLVTLMDYKDMYIEAQFPENLMSSIEKGTEVYITNYTLKRDTLAGRVSQISPAINEETRTFAALITIENPNLKLRPGMFAKADVIIESRDSVMAIPKDIIRRVHGNSVVYTVNRTTAVEKPIKTGISDNRWIEVTEGLEPLDKVVISGYEWLQNRSKVSVVN